MAQFDLMIVQNVAPSGVEFTERYVNVPKGALISGAADGSPLVLQPGTNGYQLVRDDAELTGLKWVAVSGGHTQGTDTGTTSDIFEIDSDGFKIEVTAESAAKLGIKVDGGAAYADFQAKDGTFNKVTVGSASPIGAYELTHKTYVDGLFAANDAMLFKGTIGTAGTHTIAAFNALTTYNAGWTYRVIEAGTIRGVVCEIGDIVMVLVDRSGAGNVNTDFTVQQTNIDGAVIGPASTSDNFLVLFNGATGKLIKAGTGAPGTAAYANTGDFATAAQGTLATNAIPKGTITAADQIVYGTAANTPAALAVGASTFVGRKASGGLAAMSVAEASTLLGLGTMAAETAVNYMLKSLYDANTILIATADNTPIPLTIGATTIVGRKASGDIVALTPAEIMSVIAVTAPATKTSSGVAGQIAFDDNFFYRATATNVWKRSALATNW
jgi:hypothetical protein